MELHFLYIKCKYIIYFRIFVTLSTINWSVLVIYALLFFLLPSYDDRYIVLGYSIFSSIISILLLISGIHITNIFKQIFQKTQNINHTKFSEIRLIQLNSTIYTIFICSIYQFIFIYLKNFVHQSEYKESNQVIPNTILTFWLHFFYLIADLLINLSNYVSFYFIVKHQFTKAKIIEKGEDLKIEEYLDYDVIEEKKINEDMKKFLIEDDSKISIKKINDPNTSNFEDSFQIL